MRLTNLPTARPLRADPGRSGPSSPVFGLQDRCWPTAVIRDWPLCGQPM